jgi:uncharacterized protein YndB with AHSA1/START domain
VNDSQIMNDSETLKVTTPTEREIAMTRIFDAPRMLVFEALTKPGTLMRWFHGPPGWALAVCKMDLQVGGAYRWEWIGPSGTPPPERIVQPEAFDQVWYPGGAVVTLALSEASGKTTLTLTVRYESREARDGVLKTDMRRGVAAGYDRLAGLLASPAVRAANGLGSVCR